MFHLRCTTDGAAFEDSPGLEIARMLRKACDDIDEGCVAGALVDLNGNQVGNWSISLRPLYDLAIHNWQGECLEIVEGIPDSDIGHHSVRLRTAFPHGNLDVRAHEGAGS